MKAWRDYGLRVPAIDVGTERYEFTIDLRLAHLLSEDDLVWLRSISTTWTQAEQLALVVAKHEGSVDNQTLRAMTGEHATDVTKILGGLRDQGLLEMSGIGRTASYRLGPRAMSELITIAERLSSGK